MLNVDAAADRRDFTVRAALDVADGERVALFGPSGAGKTTVLEVIAGLVAPARGRVELGGRVLTCTAAPAVAVPPWLRRVGLLRQDPGLFPHLSVRANLTYARSARAAGGRLGRGGGPGGRIWPRSPPRSGLTGCSRRCPPGCRAGSGTGWRSAACCSRTATRCCSTSRSRRSTPRCADR